EPRAVLVEAVERIGDGLHERDPGGCGGVGAQLIFTRPPEMLTMPPATLTWPPAQVTPAPAASTLPPAPARVEVGACTVAVAGLLMKSITLPSPRPSLARSPKVSTRSRQRAWRSSVMWRRSTCSYRRRTRPLG